MRCAVAPAGFEREQLAEESATLTAASKASLRPIITRTVARAILASGLTGADGIDHYALFDDVVLVAKKAHAATAGWRAICVRARRTIGKKVTDPLSNLDLDDEVAALSERVRRVASSAPEGIDTLVFGLFDGVDDDGQ